MDKRRIRVETITYQRANNYGAALQMFALQKVLERMDTDTGSSIIAVLTCRDHIQWRR